MGQCRVHGRFVCAPRSVLSPPPAREHLMAPISSLSNARVKALRGLRERKTREQTGLFLVEGVRGVQDALQLGADVEQLVVAPDLLRHPVGPALFTRQQRLGTACLEVSAEVYDSITRGVSLKYGPQGLAAVVRQAWLPLPEAIRRRDRCWVALDAVADPGNLGTILRTCDAVGAAGVILLGPTADPYDPAAVRASMGAIFSRRLVRATFAELVAARRRHGFTVVGTSGGATADYRSVIYRPPVVLLMGSEHTGLSPQQQELCDLVVRIPMVGRADSLNVAVATGVVLYEIFHQQPPNVIHEPMLAV
ncbi:MAG: tRNA (guanosine(18)-2'-O)-methyltransferase [uncultured Chloroflexia bacterium]|uniref:tRNA (Guanosine(18)-2'-O)-methyltransferase n=1 Tax=uncultured Chloroflexia bacterium TaxID=1672391 RepID=A0A6J4K418_9CHLR|nr:MAG: tRNA (guanosine(18)-2'-O)-methyltransferase [uncultured Chloroflexia bacterium]